MCRLVVKIAHLRKQASVFLCPCLSSLLHMGQVSLLCEDVPSLKLVWSPELLVIEPRKPFKSTKLNEWLNYHTYYDPFFLMPKCFFLIRN